MIQNHAKKLQLLLPMLLVACSTNSSNLRDKIALDPNVCVMETKTKEIDCKREINDEKNLVCFTPSDLELLLKKCKENK